MTLPTPETLSEVSESGLRDPGTRIEHQPSFNRSRFKCPRCSVVAVQSWVRIYKKSMEKRGSRHVQVETMINDLALSQCLACSERCLWFEREMIYPPQANNYPVPVDMPQELRKDFEEAAIIANASPRAAAALLRMCIEGICKKITGKTKFDDAIGELERQGIPDEIATAMDVVRLTGNEVLHAGQLYGLDDARTVAVLFRLTNLIVKWAITEKKELADLLAAIPEAKLESIKARRNRNTTKTTPASSN